MMAIETTVTEREDPLSHYARTRDRGMRNQIVGAHRGLALHVASRYSGRGVPLEDLRQTALLSLVKAVDRFDPERGVPFGSYAAQLIEGGLKEHFRDSSWAVHVPRRAKERSVSLRRAEEQLTHDLGRSPTVPELADALDLSTDDVLQALNAAGAYRVTSIESKSVEKAIELGVATPDTGYEHVEMRTLVATLLDTLEPRERRILELRYFEGRSQSEIAGEMGCSQMHVSRLLRRSLGRLRERLER
jgi:RNA polymerase sigma-B factor